MPSIAAACFSSIVLCLVTVTSGKHYPDVKYADKNCDKTIIVASDVRIRLTSSLILSANPGCSVTLRPAQGGEVVAKFREYSMSFSHSSESGNCQYESIQLTDYNGVNLLGIDHYCSSMKPPYQYYLKQQGKFGYRERTSSLIAATVDLLVTEVVVKNASSSCPSGFFDCQTGFCVTEDVTCNGYDDCGNNEDEIAGCGLSVGVIVGVAVGVFVSIIIVVVLALVFRRYRRRVTYVQYRRRTRRNARTTAGINS